jgi:hypothetical protein
MPTLVLEVGEFANTFAAPPVPVLICAVVVIVPTRNNPDNKCVSFFHLLIFIGYFDKNRRKKMIFRSFFTRNCKEILL